MGTRAAREQARRRASSMPGYYAARHWARAAVVPARVLPSVLLIGAQKCGTSSLHHYLVQHPDVGASRNKEMHYFDLRADRPLREYRACFPVRGQFRHIIESSPYYLFHPAVPQRVRATLPNARLIVLLRDPVQRAYSQYQQSRARGFEDLEFRAAIEQEDARLARECERLLAEPGARPYAHQRLAYVRRSLYGVQLKRWYEQFPFDQVLVVQSEDLFSDPSGTVQRVQNWLGLESFRPDSLQPVNVREYADLDTEVAASLRARFRPDRDELEHITGIRFGWPR